jgi:hypothetical protein
MAGAVIRQLVVKTLRAASALVICISYGSASGYKTAEHYQRDNGRPAQRVSRGVSAPLRIR